MTADALMDYLHVIGWAGLTVTGLIVGALLGLSGRFGHGAVARITALGAGLIMAAATVELAAEALEVHPWTGALVLMLGAALFSGINDVLARRGAADRKRCGECLEQRAAPTVPSSGLAITVGTAVDAVPEALLLGLVLRTGGVDLALISAIAIGNLPEALAASSGMAQSGRSRRWVLGTWTSIAGMTVLLTVVGYAASSLLTETTALLLQALGAGALLALVAETMLPEAAEGNPRFSGLVAAAGFSALLLIATL